MVVADSRSPRDGAFIEIIGHYDPLTEPDTLVIDEEKALKWLSHGARPTDTALRLLSKSGVMEKFKPTSVKKSPALTPRKRKTKTPDEPKSTTEESSK